MNIALIGSGGREHAICEKIFYQKKQIKFTVFLETPELQELHKM